MARILIVEDDDDFRDLLHCKVMSLGHSVVCASDGVQATKALEEAQFDLLLTDLIMPDKDGIEVITGLRKAHSSMKIIAMSGGSNTAFVKSNLQCAAFLGATGILKKPFDSIQLETAINEALASH